MLISTNNFGRLVFQPHQVYDDNTQRIALRRRLVEDDQWVVPHNLCFTMFSTSSVNVIGFDPFRTTSDWYSSFVKCLLPLHWPGARGMCVWGVI